MSDFLELSEKRFSARKFTDQSVSGDDLEYILNSTRLAPSACNRQPWKFIVVASEENKTKLQECYDREWFKTAPVYIICMKNTAENWIRPYDNKPHGDIDAPNIFVLPPQNVDWEPVGCVITTRKRCRATFHARISKQ